MNTNKLLETINTQGSAAAIEALKAECRGDSDLIFTKKDGTPCNAKSPVLQDDWGDDRVTYCMRPVGHTGRCCGTDGAHGWLRWEAKEKV